MLFAIKHSLDRAFSERKPENKSPTRSNYTSMPRSWSTHSVIYADSAVGRRLTRSTCELISVHDLVLVGAWLVMLRSRYWRCDLTTYRCVRHRAATMVALAG